MKYILVLLVVWVGYQLWRRARIADQAAKERPPQPVNTPMAMVACAHCGTHLPQTEALSDGGHFFATLSTATTMPVDKPSDWDGGWWRHARRCDSPNFGPRPAGVDIDLVVIHSISLPPGVYGTPHVEALFTNQLDWDAHPYFQSIRGAEVSSHFFIRRDGEVVQFVDADARAWHAGRSSWRGREGCNDQSVGIELEGLEGLTFESTQYTALVRLCQDLRQRYPVADIAGHEHIAPGRKQDPGPGFNWAFCNSNWFGQIGVFPRLQPSPTTAQTPFESARLKDAHHQRLSHRLLRRKCARKPYKT